MRVAARQLARSDIPRAHVLRLTRLLAVIQEQVAPLPGRVFLGWSMDTHWLLKPAG